jgi:putative PIN family toxin of toxin-antitoxin system
MNVVIDTNVLLVSISKRSEYHKIWEAFTEKKYNLCITTDILEEYAEIISSYRNPQSATLIIDIILSSPNTVFITKYYNWLLITQDPDDNKFVDCAIHANASYLVTEDKHFNILKEVEFPKINVIGIDKFLNIIIQE